MLRRIGMCYASPMVLNLQDLLDEAEHAAMIEEIRRQIKTEAWWMKPLGPPFRPPGTDAQAKAMIEVGRGKPDGELVVFAGQWWEVSRLRSAGEAFLTKPHDTHRNGQAPADEDPHSTK